MARSIFYLHCERGTLARLVATSLGTLQFTRGPAWNLLEQLKPKVLIRFTKIAPGYKVGRIREARYKSVVAVILAQR
jgi:hypothetical protein